MTLIDSEGLEATRTLVKQIERRLGYVENELRQINIRLRTVAPTETVRFPGTPSTPPAQPSGYYCSFCGKAQEEVALLIAGPAVGLFICSACVDLCSEIVQTRLATPNKDDPHG